MSDASCCESCANYVFNEDYEAYECLVSMDEDEYYSLVCNKMKDCPYYRSDDEYAIVRKQN